MEKKHALEIQKLVREGKQISKVMEENFPEYEYWDIYMAAYDGGERSALGVKRMITNRLNKMVESRKSSERKEIQEELDALVWHLYESLKDSQKKLEKIRRIINK
ncbi:hypothetical protein [Aeromonas veronii]|jgi:hypothetical protein|uniref:hypothetical protein n=1 Tax=Aeromonas TaxID=642 RepID=UPI003D1AFA1B